MEAAAATAKTINVPSADIVEVIKNAREFLKTQDIDMSHRFLARVEYKNLHSEYVDPYWVLTFALLAGTSEGQIHVRVFNTGKIAISPAE